MKFIFPGNYSFKNKILGFIDYSTAIFNLIVGGLLFFILNLISIELIVKISIFIIIYFPIILFSVLGFYNESILYVLKYMIKYMKSPKVYLFYKE
ncbi:MAG: hypothetical protein LBL91_00425 [Lachnospiraceae bacterium]|jgi:hypothetical protein|nr:hypothetical protein [Lachnospiraceae bacterium]